MRRALHAVLLVAVGATPAFAAFAAGVLEPVPPRVSAEARRSGLLISSSLPAGSAVESAAVPAAVHGGPERMADWAKLRFLLWRAAAKGAEGVWFQLPEGDLLDFPEEWQALARVARELRAARPILEGTDAPAPFDAPPGVLVRSWSRGGRRYVLLVNDSSSPAPLAAEVLAPWRALFAIRADARQLLPPCGAGSCLPTEGVLWLEGRPGTGLRR